MAQEYHQSVMEGNTQVASCDDQIAPMGESVGERLRRERKALGLTQGELAKKASSLDDFKIGQTGVANIEGDIRQYGRSLLGIAKALGVSPDYLTCKTDERHAGGGFQAHDMSLYAHTVPSLITWEELMQSKKLPESFRCAMPDDSMAPRTPRGTELVFSTTAAPRPGVGVLVELNERRYIRRYVETPDGWKAQPANDAYATLEGCELLAVVVGVMTGDI